LTHGHRTTHVLTWTIPGCLLTALPGRAQIGSCTTIPAGTSNYTFNPGNGYNDGTVNATQQAHTCQVEPNARRAISPGRAGLYQVAIQALEPFGVAPREPVLLTSDKLLRRGHSCMPCRD
jgi:hypothetical protein